MKNLIYVTVKEAAEFLKVTPSTIYKLIYNKELPYYKPTGKVYLKVEDLIEFLERGKVKASWELVEKEKGVSYV